MRFHVIDLQTVTEKLSRDVSNSQRRHKPVHALTRRSNLAKSGEFVSLRSLASGGEEK